MPAGGAVNAARADCIVGNCVDFIAEGRLSFHPTDAKASYASQKDAADQASRVFASERLLVWLAHFEAIIAAAASVQGVGPVLRDDGNDKTPSYADIMLFYVLDATAGQFDNDFYGNVWTKSSQRFPLCHAFHQWIASQPRLEEYFSSERCQPWAGDSMM